MTRYSDLTRSLIQERMPSQVRVVETKVLGSRGSGYHGLYGLLSIKHLTKAEANEIIDFTPRGEYCYSILKYHAGTFTRAP